MIRAAALATSTTLTLTAAPAHLDQRNNSLMALAYKSIMKDCFEQDIVIVGSSDGGAGGGSFSTDFGNGDLSLSPSSSSGTRELTLVSLPRLLAALSHLRFVPLLAPFPVFLLF